MFKKEKGICCICNTNEGNKKMDKAWIEKTGKEIKNLIIFHKKY